MSTGPQRQVCPLCALDDPEFVSWEVEAPGLWRYTCTNPSHPEPYAWLTTGRSRLAASGNDGLSAELGLYEDLLACFEPGEQLIEYGIVEYRYAVTNPDTYKYIVSLHSHTGFGEPIGYSASAFIGAALGKLGREGLLLRQSCRATGYWSYNGTLHAWGLPPARGEGEIVTWSQFASSVGLEGGSWPRALLG